MKKLFLAALASTCLMAGGLYAQDEKAATDAPALELKTKQEKISYMIGYDVGRALGELGVELDLKVFDQAAKDSIAGRESTLSQEDAMQMMMEIKQEAAAKQKEAAAKQKEAGAKKLVEVKKWLAEKAKEDGVQATESGLLYIMKEEGDGANPVATDTVKVHYHGTLSDGTVFDSSVDRGQPATFPLNRVIPAWTEGIPLAKVGGEIQLIVPPELGYGEQGSPPKIGPNEVLIFDVMLLDIVTPDPVEAIPAQK